MKKIIKIVMPILVTVVSIVAIVFSSIAIATRNDQKILDAYQVGLKGFFEDNITRMYIDSGHNPNHMGEFSDEAVLNEMRSLLKTAVYQKTDPYKPDHKLGSDSFAYIEFDTNENKYYFSVAVNKLHISINTDSSYYNCNVSSLTKELINETLDALFD